MFVDFFSLARSDVALLTHWSLFGRAATEVGIKPGRQEGDAEYFINDSKCGSPGHKPCSDPYFPDVCPDIKPRPSAQPRTQDDSEL